MAERYDSLEMILDNITARDKSVFRILFESNPYDLDTEQSEERLALQEKTISKPKRELESDLNQRINELSKHVDKLESSWKRIKTLGDSLGQNSSNIPSIQPVLNKQLTLLTAGYGTILNPFYRTLKSHQGIDYTVAEGSSVFATADGVVKEISDKNSTLGKTIVIDHQNGYKTSYSHLMSVVVRRGQKVERGDIIALSGNSGLSLAPPLHYEVRYNDMRIGQGRENTKKFLEENEDIRLEIEETALKKESDTISKEHLEEIQKELSELREQFNAMKAQWENEKTDISAVQKLREEIENVSGQIEQAEREYDLNKAAELKYGTMPKLKNKRAELESQAENKNEENRLLRDRVTEDEIAKIVCRWTGIPVSKLMEGEKEKILGLEALLHKRVIGQDEAVTKVSEAIIRSRAGIQSPDRPIGSFLFLGPTGVGKTELAKALSEILFDDEKNIVRIDMSEYMEKFSVSRLIGAPPGYVGYDEGGQLTEAVRRKPYSVVLFDEIEKAHPDVFNVLLQILDDGRITDSQGRTVDFKNTIIILTSNLGSPYILEGIGSDGEITAEAREMVENLLKQQFRPEFLNRLDEIIFYKPLAKTEIIRIVDLMLGELQKRLDDKHISINVTDAAKKHIVDCGYDVNFGARPLRRYIQRTVETLAAKCILGGGISASDTITIDVDGDKLIAE